MVLEFVDRAIKPPKKKKQTNPPYPPFCMLIVLDNYYIPISIRVLLASTDSIIVKLFVCVASGSFFFKYKMSPSDGSLCCHVDSI